VQPGPEGIDFRQIMGILRHRLPLIAACVVIATGAAYGFSKRETKKYTTTASIVFNDNTLSQQIAGLGVSASTASSLLAEQAGNLELVRGSGVAAKTASLVGHGLTPADVASSVSVSGQPESGVVDVTTVSTSPVLAAKITNTYARQFISVQQVANRQYFKSALAAVEKQLAALPPRQRVGPDSLQLQNRAQALRLLTELGYGNVQVGREAFIPSSPSSPKTSRNTALGLFLGVVIGLIITFALERVDGRIRRPEDLEAIYGLPLLGSVPKSSALARANGKDRIAPPAEAEAFGLIRGHLRFFDVDRPLRTILIASAAQGEGKSMVARNLAEAAARLGSRVLLLESDLRHPVLAAQFEAHAGPGLADVLIGTVPMSEATQSIGSGSSHGGGNLDVLVAGPVSPPNPAQLLDSHAMSAVLEQAKSTYDLVVIDTPPLTSVSDALPLLAKVDGVVIVGWIGRSRRNSAERLHQVLATSGAPLLGVVANGTGSTGSGYHVTGGRSPAFVLPQANDASSSEELFTARDA